MRSTTQQPEQYSKRILLLVIGMTPQIVTETLYKLANLTTYQQKYI